MMLVVKSMLVFHSSRKTRDNAPKNRKRTYWGNIMTNWSGLNSGTTLESFYKGQFNCDNLVSILIFCPFLPLSASFIRTLRLVLCHFVPIIASFIQTLGLVFCPFVHLSASFIHTLILLPCKLWSQYLMHSTVVHLFFLKKKNFSAFKCPIIYNAYMILT